MVFWVSHFNPRILKHLHDASFEKKLGEGSFGKVKIYKCKEKNCNKTYCEQCFVVKTIKICNFKRNFSYFFCKSGLDYIKKTNVKLKSILLNEWEIGKDLEHSNIIKTLDIDLKKMSLILEYYESIDLFTYFSSKIFEYPVKTKNEYSIKIYKQILNGVNYLHENNIVHLDLKLENIIINTESRIIKIIDFGKATRINTESKKCPSKLEWGTLQYLPPEYFKKYYSQSPNLNEDKSIELVNIDIDMIKVDIWACGILFYNFIYNATPWNMAYPEKDWRYNDFVKYFYYNVLTDKIFPDLYRFGWTLENICIINILFRGVFTQEHKNRIQLCEIINIINKITFV